MSEQAFLNRDYHKIVDFPLVDGFDQGNRIGFEIYQELKELGIEISFSLKGKVNRLHPASKEAMPAHRAEIIACYLAEQLYRLARIWARNCYDRGSKTFRHEDERYYYLLKGRASLVMPRGIDPARLALENEYWDPSLSSYHSPDGKYYMDIKLWPRNCKTACWDCAVTAGQQELELAS